MINQLLNALINRRATATPKEAKRIDDKLREVKTCANEDEMIGVLLGQKRPPTARELDHQTLRQRVVEKRQKIEAGIAHLQDVRRRTTYEPAIAQEFERMFGVPYDPILRRIEDEEIDLHIWDAVLDLLDAHPEIIPYSYLAGAVTPWEKKHIREH
ncbi:MAG: hypothetical protein J6S27_03795, partial [Thermoguttaceae bacterium]|nr:hypothetical protein [Thermoguttaceae bacterium]